MARIDDILRISRSCVPQNGMPALSVVLSSGQYAILKYAAKSVEDADKYEAETILELTHSSMPTLIDKAIRCEGCALLCPYPDLAERADRAPGASKVAPTKRSTIAS
jgi:hypothetical protein